MKSSPILKLITMILIGAALGCSNSNGNQKDSNKSPKGENKAKDEKAFDGRMHSFSVYFSSPLSGALTNKPYLTYSFVIARNSGSKGTINIYDCQDSTCAVKYLTYKAECYLEQLTCKLVDRLGNEVTKGGKNPSGGVYQVNAGDIGNVDVVGQCHKYVGGVSEEWCTYISIIDPMLRPEEFHDQYLATEFVPSKGPKTDLVIYHLKN